MDFKAAIIFVAICLWNFGRPSVCQHDFVQVTTGFQLKQDNLLMPLVTRWFKRWNPTPMMGTMKKSNKLWNPLFTSPYTEMCCCWLLRFNWITLCWWTKWNAEVWSSNGLGFLVQLHADALWDRIGNGTANVWNRIYYDYFAHASTSWIFIPEEQFLRCASFIFDSLAVETNQEAAGCSSSLYELFLHIINPGYTLDTHTHKIHV